VALRHTGNTSVIVFVEEHSLRVLAVHLAKSWHKCHLSDVAGNLVTNDTTPHIHGKAMLVVAFDSSMQIIMIP
jgi:sugar diacid utilization regulator